MNRREFDVSSLIERRAWRGNRVCMGDIIERPTWCTPNKKAFIAMEGACHDQAFKELTYKQANEKANQIANALLAEGLKRGDTVLVVGTSSVELALTFLGTAKAGLTAVPINSRLASDVLDYLMAENSGAGFTIVEAASYTPALAEAMQKNNLKVGATIPIGGDAIPGSKSFSDFIQGQPTEEPEVDIQPNDIYLILYTSGTTAMPRGAMLSHLNCYLGNVDFAISSSRGLMLEDEIIGWNGYPYFHSGGQKFTYAPICMGGTVVISRVPYAEQIAEAITKYKVTTVLTSPSIFGNLCEMAESNPDKYDLTSLKVGFHGWGSMHPDIVKRLEKLCPGIIISCGDGQSEDTAVDQRFWHHRWWDKCVQNPTTNYFGTSHPMRSSTIMKAEEDDSFTEPFEIGEKVMRSPTSMHGYYKDLETTQRVFTPKGWFRGGDGGYLDEDGLIVFADRIKDVIKSGGENVVSARVEAVINLHPKVAQTAVVGLPHARWEEAVTAFVILRKGETVSEKEIIDLCKANLAGFEVPKKVVFLEDLPETLVGSGKIQKFKLRQDYAGLYENES